MKKWIFLFLAICMVLISPTTAMANYRDGPQSDVQVQFVSSPLTGTIELSGCAAITTPLQDKAATATWMNDLITITMNNDESRISNLAAIVSFTRDDAMMTILSREAQKTKFPSSTLSAEVSNNNLLENGLAHLRV